MSAYYNEIDPFAAEWLRQLIKAGLIAPGEVDERDVQDVRPEELKGFTQCHFFAGIGVWSYALRQAGWPDDRPVWTGSPPCQPFSTAGQGKGFADKRHLWPDWFHLIEECRPGIVFGEQVASKAGRAWFGHVQADLEALGYSAAGFDLCSAGVGAPHIRQRLYWVAISHVLANAACERGNRCQSAAGQTGRPGAEDGGAPGQLDDANSDQFTGREIQLQPWQPGQEGLEPNGPGGPRNARPTNGFWADADWLGCRDGRWRQVEPGTFPLAHGAPVRVGRLRCYGNAINAELTREFIAASIEELAA